LHHREARAQSFFETQRGRGTGPLLIDQNEEAGLRNRRERHLKGGEDRVERQHGDDNEDFVDVRH